jgi:hypothetical protein
MWTDNGPPFQPPTLQPTKKAAFQKQWKVYHEFVVMFSPKNWTSLPRKEADEDLTNFMAKYQFKWTQVPIEI